MQVAVCLRAIASNLLGHNSRLQVTGIKYPSGRPTLSAQHAARFENLIILRSGDCGTHCAYASYGGGTFFAAKSGFRLSEQH
jgi:hypothetical protein